MNAEHTNNKDANSKDTKNTEKKTKSEDANSKDTKNTEKETISCRICKSIETRLSLSGQEIWINDINEKGEFTGRYICYKCHFNPICSICGMKHEELYKVYNSRGYWTGDQVCKHCHEKISRMINAKITR